MGRDVIIACDFASREQTMNFLDKFQEEKPFVKIGMELYYAEGPQIVRVMDDALFAMCADAGIAVSAWTANQEEDIRRLYEKNVVNITTNNPELALEILSAGK